MKLSDPRGRRKVSDLYVSTHIAASPRVDAPRWTRLLLGCGLLTSVVLTSGTAHAQPIGNISNAARLDQQHSLPDASIHIVTNQPGGSHVPHFFVQPHLHSQAQSATNNLFYGGGPVMAGTVHVYAIFWEPTGNVSANYNSLLKRYFGDVGGNPLYAIANQYTQTSGTFPANTVLAGSWVDSGAYPASPLLDSNIQNEVTHAQQVNGWSSSIDNVFFVIIERDTKLCFDGTSQCSTNFFCGYHNYFGTNTIYAALPYEANLGGCDTGSSPNHDDADVTISIASHEQMEAATDPLLSAWSDSSGQEIGDKCAFVFGPLDSQGADVTWNNHPYIVQEEWDNHTSSCRLTPSTTPTVTLNVPSPITTNATSTHGAAVTYTVTATDSTYPADQVTINCTPASGSTFAIGTTTVNCTASDPAGGHATGSFPVTVNDTDLALTGVPSNRTVNATSPQGAVVTYTAPTALDEDSSSPTVQCTPASGSTFAISTTTVTCTASDSDDTPSTVSGSFMVTVKPLDNDLALTNVPANISTNATNAQGAVVTYTPPTATDEAGDTPGSSVSCSPASGSTFAIGTTTVTCTATDSDDTNSPVTASFTVTVKDTDLALTNVPSSITTNATSAQGAVVTYTAPTATDEDGSSPSVSCTPASGSTFAIGTTTVTCTASDSDDTPSTVSGSFTITVVDKLPPSLQLPPSPLTVDATSSQGASVSYTVTATDPVYPANQLTISCTPASGSTFAIGDTTVNCTVSDPAGNSVSGSFTVTIVDHLPPSLHLPSSPLTIDATSPQGATVSYTVTATDPVYPASQLTISCTPVSGSTFAISSTTVNCRVSDPAGNTASGSFTVVVNGAVTQINNLITTVDSFNLPQPTQMMLDKDLQKVLDDLNKGHLKQACMRLDKFIKDVQHQAGSDLTQSQAAQLIASAKHIQAVLGC